MKKFNFLLFTFIFVIFFSFFCKANAQATCLYEVIPHEASDQSLDNQSNIYGKYIIEIDSDNKKVKFTYSCDGCEKATRDSLSDLSDSHIFIAGDTRTFDFAELKNDGQEDHYIGVFIKTPYESSSSLINLSPVLDSIENGENCSSEQLVYNFNSFDNHLYVFRFKEYYEKCDGDNPYGNALWSQNVCVTPGNLSEQNSCSPTIGQNSFTDINYTFIHDSDLKKIRISSSGTEIDLNLNYNYDDNSLYALLNSSQCSNCFEKFHTAASGRKIFEEVVPIILDKELVEQIFSNNSCPAKIYAMLTFVELGNTGKPQFSDSLNSSFSDAQSNLLILALRGWQGIVGDAFWNYVGKNTEYNYSDYNYATIILTTQDCGDGCFSVTTSDSLVIVPQDKDNLDIGAVNDCTYLKANEFWNWLSSVLKLLRIGAIVLVVVLTGVDSIKVFASSDDKNVKTFYKRLLNRLICVGLLVLVPSLIQLVINIFSVNDIISKISESESPFCGLRLK